jgi:tRNA U34 5-methylaminomethyl-2-thiouridine-forming methyltransferase MnmC
MTIESRLENIIELTDDGSKTVRSGLTGETYHSLRGAVGESRHVFIEAGFLPISGVKSEPIFVFELGLGTGLNAWLTLLETEKLQRQVEYVAVEKHPVNQAITAQLEYSDDPRFAAMHSAPWGERTQISEHFGLLKLHGDAAEILGKAAAKAAKAAEINESSSGGDDNDVQNRFDVVYWDAFAPDVQPELWTPEIFTKVASQMAPAGILVTYSAKGDVRRALLAAGFEVEKLPGALGKRHMIRARSGNKNATKKH